MSEIPTMQDFLKKITRYVCTGCNSICFGSKPACDCNATVIAYASSDSLRGHGGVSPNKGVPSSGSKIDLKP